MNPKAPNRCFISNEPTFGIQRIKARLGWGRGYSGKIPVPLAVKVALGLADMRFLTVEVSISDREAQKRATVLLAYGAMFLMAAALLGHGISLGFPPQFAFMLPGVLLGIVAITLFANKYVMFHVVFMDAEHIWLRGAGTPFLQSLPHFEGRHESPG